MIHLLFVELDGEYDAFVVAYYGKIGCELWVKLVSKVNLDLVSCNAGLVQGPQAGFERDRIFAPRKPIAFTFLPLDATKCHLTRTIGGFWVSPALDVAKS